MKLVDALRRALQNGPVAQHELAAALEQLGQRRPDLGAIWQTCQEHGLADLVGSEWVPRGWAAPSSAPTTERPQFRVRHRDPDGLDNATRRKINDLRTALGLTRAVEESPVPVPASWASAVRGAAGALTDELSEVTRRRTQTDIPLRAGHVVAEGPTLTLMRFEADGEVSAREGTDATLVESPGDAVPVQVISVFGAVVTLALPSGASTPAVARLRCDLSWLLTTQSRRLNELIEGGTGFNADAALAVVTPNMHVAPSATSGRRWTSLNDAQSRAVESGLRDGITWLWGPPGTGKTTTLSVLVEELCRRGRRTLLTAPTNTAVDIALQAVLGRMGATVPGKVVRVGQPTDTRLVRRTAGPSWSRRSRSSAANPWPPT